MFTVNAMAVLGEAVPVCRRVHRVVGLVTDTREPRELAHDHGRVTLVVALWVEVAELQDACVGDVLVGVVHHRRPLEVADIEHLLLEVERSPPGCAPRPGPAGLPVGPWAEVWGLRYRSAAAALVAVAHPRRPPEVADLDPLLLEVERSPPRRGRFVDLGVDRAGVADRQLT